jgi:hypothetical protein
VGFIRSELAVIDVLHIALTNAVYDVRALGHDVFTAPKLTFPARLANQARGPYLRKRVTVPAP